MTRPALHALLNALSAALLVAGWSLIKSKRPFAHRVLMSAAFACSAVFLASYLEYHARVGSVRFQGTGWIRTVYFTILLTHTVLAVAILPVILRTFWLAYAGRHEEHKRWARWAFPSWLYVSTTGVVIYWMLYRL